ncbi:MAG TPA: neutral zinc metallopeptidase [Solirubrobacterales bacterium]|nr:neutral zinc metallopeptidase [Solirubrobacterales bacterium]
MKWRRGTKSRDVIDIRGASTGSGRGGGGLPIPGGIGKLGGGAGLIVLLVIIGISLLGGDGGAGLPGTGTFGGATAPGAANPQPLPPGEDPQADLKDFSTYVFDDAQDVWAGTFSRGEQRYDNAQLVLYTGAVQTDGCGGATSAVGPFYCPADGRVYLDLSFYADMKRQLGAPGDFAWAYVIAHEMGHHVQRLTGTSDEVDRLSRDDPGAANDLSVRQELQADCYAGVWAGTVFAAGDLEPGDLDEAFTAAEAVGDDRLQRQAGGQVDPDSFTHGTSEQRRRWFDHGFRSGNPADCNTFAADEL